MLQVWSWWLHATVLIIHPGLVMLLADSVPVRRLHSVAGMKRGLMSLRCLLLTVVSAFPFGTGTAAGESSTEPAQSAWPLLGRTAENAALQSARANRLIEREPPRAQVV